MNTDGPLDHYVVSFSPNGQGTDVHGAGGVQSLYPLHYPQPGYPINIDDTYQKTLANARQWAMLLGPEPGLLCTVGLTSPDGTGCLSGRIIGSVPLIMKSSKGIPFNVQAGKKVLNYDQDNDTYVYYEESRGLPEGQAEDLGHLVEGSEFGFSSGADRTHRALSAYAAGHVVTRDVLRRRRPIATRRRHAGTFMFISDPKTNTVMVSFGNSCASSPHLAGHVQETGTGNNPLPLRDYVALNNTVDELIVFGNEVALKHPGWIVNRELLPPNLVEKNQQGFSAADLKAELIGTIVKGTAYSRAEVYKSGVITSPLQLQDAVQRLLAMNRALGAFSETLRKRSAHPRSFTALEPMPGNSFDPQNQDCLLAVAAVSLAAVDRVAMLRRSITSSR